MLDPKLKPLFDKYNTVLKPLIAEYESRNENFVTSLLKDIPGMFDYIALYFYMGDCSYIHKAEHCLDEAIRNMKICLIGSMMKDIKSFESRYPKRIRQVLDGGKFYGAYQSKINKIKQLKSDDIFNKYKLLKDTESLIMSVQSSSVSTSVVIDKKRTTIIKWILTILIALVCNYLFFRFR